MTISMTNQQTEAVQAELTRVLSLTQEATKAPDTGLMVSKLRAVSGACLNAIQVIRDVEADIRMTGQKEHA